MLLEHRLVRGDALHRGTLGLRVLEQLARGFPLRHEVPDRGGVGRDTQRFADRVDLGIVERALLIVGELVQDHLAHLLEGPRALERDLVGLDHVPAAVALPRAADLAGLEREHRVGERGLAAEHGEHAVLADRAEHAAVGAGQGVL